MTGYQGAAVLGTACVSLLGWLPHQASATPLAGPVTANAQASRDAERLRILNEELAAERRRVEEAARLHAERLVAADPRGAQEPERALTRARQNIDALQREILATTRLLDGRSSTPRTPQPAKAHPVLASGPAGATAPPWWDVYAKSSSPKASPDTDGPAAPVGSPAPQVARDPKP
jgi:hypothetical protein